VSNLFGVVRRSVLQLSIASSLIAAPAAALSLFNPTVLVTIDGLPVGTLSCGPLGFVCDELGIATLVEDLTFTSLTGDSVTLNRLLPDGTPFMLDPDPQIVYSSTITDIGAPSTFSFVFSQAIVATAAPGLADHTMSSNTTDGSTNGAPVTAAAAPFGVPVDPDGIPEIAKYTLSTNGGVTLVSAAFDLGPSFVAATGSTSQGPYVEGGSGPLGAGSYNFMRVDVNVTLGGGGDRYAFNGRASIVEDVVVPEPRTGALVALGFVALAVRRRSRAA